MVIIISAFIKGSDFRMGIVALKHTSYS